MKNGQRKQVPGTNTIAYPKLGSLWSVGSGGTEPGSCTCLGGQILARTRFWCEPRLSEISFASERKSCSSERTKSRSRAIENLVQTSERDFRRTRFPPNEISAVSDQNGSDGSDARIELKIGEAQGTVYCSRLPDLQGNPVGDGRERNAERARGGTTGK